MLFKPDSPRQFRFEEICVKTIGGGQEVMCLNWEATQEGFARLITGSRGRIVQAWNFNLRGSLSNKFLVQIESTLPIVVFFVDNVTKDILVFGQTDGSILTLNVKDGTILSTTEIGILMGTVGIGAHKSSFVVDNVSTGFSLYSTETGLCIRTYPTGTPVSSLPKQVAFAEGDSAIVRGSDNGSVYVFDKKTGSPLDLLRHSNKGLVQTVATHYVDEISTIVSTSSNKNKEATILVWKWKREPIQKECQFPSVGSLISKVCQVLVLIWISVALYNYIVLMTMEQPSAYSLQPTTRGFHGLQGKLRDRFRSNPPHSNTVGAVPAITKLKHAAVSKKPDQQKEDLMSEYVELLVKRALWRRNEADRKNDIIILGPN